MESIDLFVLDENAECESIPSERSILFTQRPVDNRFLEFRLNYSHKQRRRSFNSSSEKRNFLDLMWGITSVGTSLYETGKLNHKIRKIEKWEVRSERWEVRFTCCKGKNILAPIHLT